MGICCGGQSQSVDTQSNTNAKTNASKQNNVPSPNGKGLNKNMGNDPKSKHGGEVDIEKGPRKVHKKMLDVNGVGDDDETIHEKITKMPKDMNFNDVSFIIKSLKNHFFFSNLTEDELENVISKMFYASVDANAYIFKQHDKASCYFILAEGSVNVEINLKNGEMKKKTLNAGAGFGELAQLYNAPRSGSIKAVKKSYFWCIDRRTFKIVVEEISTKQYDENRKWQEKVSFFSSMNESQKDSIASAIINQKFENGRELVSVGDQADSYYIIKEGTVECVAEGGKVVREQQAGDNFGEAALYESSQRTLTVRAKGVVRCMAQARDAQQTILGNEIQEVIYCNWQRWALEKNEVFGKLTKIQTEKWILNSKISKVEANHVIYKAGDKFTDLIIIVEGDAVDKSDDTSYPKGTVFNESFVYPQIDPKRRVEADVVMVGKGVISRLPIAKLNIILGGDLQTILQKNTKSHENRMGKQDLGFRDAVQGMSLKELVFIKKLGEGQFGHVFLAYSDQTKDYYALKAISKAQIIEQNLEKHTIQEKAVLAQVEFPLLIRMYRTFKDEDFVYFLLSFVRGMELFDVIRQMDLLDNKQSQFYIGAMILSIEYLHSLKIVYRDIKPENIMIDHCGQLRLIDMGTAKILKSKHGMNRTFTILGTPHYMAPEILLGKGYGLLVDLWSIGICLYEFMCGLVPFGEDCEDPYEVYQLISTQPLQYPVYFMIKPNKNARNLIQQLLNRSPDARLGSSFAALKADEWFDSLDWDKLVSGDEQAPYVPPKNLVINHREMDAKALEGIPVVQEAKKSASKFKKTGREVSTMPNWDKDF